jgi:hypothetical protein
VGGDRVAGGVGSTSVGVPVWAGGKTVVIGVSVAVGEAVGSVPVAVGVDRGGTTVVTGWVAVPVGVSDSVSSAVGVGVSVNSWVGVGVSVEGGTWVGVSVGNELVLALNPTLIDPLNPVKVNLAV